MTHRNGAIQAHNTRLHQFLAGTAHATIAAASTLPGFPGRNRYENARADRLTATAATLAPAIADTYRKAARDIREQIADSTRQPV